MKFSVVIPLYNGARFIKTTLDTVLSQTYTNYEIILVNDGSPDNVEEVVNEYICSHPKVEFVYLKQKNKGLGGARNTAIRHASGDVIAILDQDDIWYPEKLERVHQVYEEHPEVSIICHNQYIRNKDKIIGKLSSGPLADDMHRNLLFEKNCLSTSATTFKKYAIEDVGYFSEEVDKLHFVEDYELWLKMALHGYEFFFMPDILGEYIKHGDNFTNYELTCKGELYVVNKHYKLLPNKNIMDWFYLRKRRAESFALAAYHAFFLNGSIAKSIFYLSYAVINNPLVLFRAVRKYLKQNLKGIRL